MSAISKTILILLNLTSKYKNIIFCFFVLNVSSESAIVAGTAVGIMIIPFLISLFCDVISSVPNRLKLGSVALGSTKFETIYKVILPASSPGIISVILMAFSRAIGETVIVLMVVGVSAYMNFNPLNSSTTMTVQIVRLLTGDQSFDSITTNVAYAIGLLLFSITWILSAFALKFTKNNHYNL